MEIALVMEFLFIVTDGAQITRQSAARPARRPLGLGVRLRLRLRQRLDLTQQVGLDVRVVAGARPHAYIQLHAGIGVVGDGDPRFGLVSLMMRGSFSTIFRSEPSDMFDALRHAAPDNVSTTRRRSFALKFVTGFAQIVLFGTNMMTPSFFVRRVVKRPISFTVPAVAPAPSM